MSDARKPLTAAPSWEQLTPPPLRRWWAGYPQLLAQETGALLLSSILPLRPADRLLVLGPAAPALAAALAESGQLTAPPVALHDGRAALRAQATRAAAAQVDLVCAPPDSLPFGSERFTVVLAGHQVRNWDDGAVERMLREAWRVLSHNGLVVIWDVAPSRSAGVTAVWRRLLSLDPERGRLRGFAALGHIGRAAGFAWIQTVRLRPFLWPPGPRVAVLMRKEHYTAETVHAPPGERRV